MSMKLFVAYSPVKPRCFLIASDEKTSCWVNTLSAIKLVTIPYVRYFMTCCAFLAKPVRKALSSSGSAPKIEFMLSLLKQYGATVQYHPPLTVPLLLNWHFATVNDQGEQCVGLAQIEGCAETFFRTLVSGLWRNLVCEGQMAQRDNIVWIYPNALWVVPLSRRHYRIATSFTFCITSGIDGYRFTGLGALRPVTTHTKNI